jgi:hypothetical protein
MMAFPFLSAARGMGGNSDLLPAPATISRQSPAARRAASLNRTDWPPRIPHDQISAMTASLTGRCRAANHITLELSVLSIKVIKRVTSWSFHAMKSVHSPLSAGLLPGHSG